VKPSSGGIGSRDRVAIGRSVRSRGDRQIGEIGRGRHFQQPLVDPASGRDVTQRGADGHIVAQHRVAGGEVGERDLVSLRDMLAQPEAAGQHAAGGQSAIVRHNGDVVALVHANGERGKARNLVHRPPFRMAVCPLSLYAGTKRRQG
jgi:hypothetical protein